MTDKCTKIDKLSRSYIFRHLCHPQGARISTLPSYTSMSDAVVGNTV